MMIQDKQVESSAQSAPVERPSKGLANASERTESAPRKEVRGADEGNEAVRPDRQQVLDLVQQAGQQLADHGVALKFHVNEDSDSIQVEVRDAASEKVIRKIPADEVVKLSKSIKDMVGAFLDKPI